MSDKRDYIRTFNKHVISLIDFLAKKSPRDKDIADRLKQRLTLARRISEDAIIREAGDYLYKYRKEILNRDEQFFVTKDILSENGVSDQFAIEIFGKIKNIYAISNVADKDYAYEIILQMLICYMEFLT